jgi:hypothetical protein
MVHIRSTVLVTGLMPPIRRGLLLAENAAARHTARSAMALHVRKVEGNVGRPSSRGSGVERHAWMGMLRGHELPRLCASLSLRSTFAFCARNRAAWRASDAVPSQRSAFADGRSERHVAILGAQPGELQRAQRQAEPAQLYDSASLSILTFRWRARPCWCRRRGARSAKGTHRKARCERPLLVGA